MISFSLGVQLLFQNEPYQMKSMKVYWDTLKCALKNLNTLSKTRFKGFFVHIKIKFFLI